METIFRTPYVGIRHLLSDDKTRILIITLGNAYPKLFLFHRLTRDFSIGEKQ